ncbi:hypothetical protein [Nostoc favosum]|uniref:Uncharacterized protein n=1 Tax=Nostoc favosum CHAB5714 TaxID=2780399 RepID=A0ABS8ICV7_9NOSO|nr:hypothetical protein [Nostoc favosum]MCC5602045.1 hypothetical protein [Nostoc favosum CHAB5714]
MTIYSNPKSDVKTSLSFLGALGVFSARRCALAEASRRDGGSLIFTTQIGLLYLYIVLFCDR